MRIIGAYNTTGADAAPDLQTTVFVQEFVSPLDNLHKVEIMFSVPPMERDQALTVEIVDFETQQVLRIANAVANKGVKDSFIEFEFDPILNSKHRKYQLRVGPEISDQSLQLKVSDADYYQQGDLYIDGQKTEQDLVFRTFHQIEGSYTSFVADSFVSKIQVDPVFFSFWVVLILGSMLVAGFGLVRAFLKSE